MKNSNTSQKAILVLALGALPLTVNGATFSDNFEGYIVGSQMHGQGGWKGWDNSPAAGAVVSNSFSASPLNSLNVSGGSDLVHTFSGATSGEWTFSIMQYVPTGAVGDSFIILLNQYNDNGPSSWSVQSHADMTANLLRADYPVNPGATLPLIRDRWVEFRADINLATNTVSEYYDGVLLTSHAWRDVPTLADPNSLNAITAVDLYANNSSPVFYDNISLAPIPEASSSVLLMVCAFGLSTVRRRQAAA